MATPAMTSKAIRVLPLLAAALLLLAGPARAAYSADGDVEILDSSNFDEMVIESGDFWLVEFYAPWCGHCKKLEPEWKQAAKELKGVARLGAVDADDDKELGGRFGVKGFPTIKAFGENKEKPEDYSSARDASSIVSWVKDKVGGSSGSGGSTLAPEITYLKTYQFLHMTPSNVEPTPKAILFTEGAKSQPPWISSLAIKYKDGKKKSVHFAHVKVEKEDGIAARFGLDDFPCLVVAVPDGSSGGEFAVMGSLKIAEKASENVKSGKDFVDQVVAGTIDEEQKKKMPSFPPPDVPRKLADTWYNPLNEDNINTHCYGGKKSICVIAFVNAQGPPGSEEFDEDAALVDLAKKYRNDPISFVWIDYKTQNEYAQEFGIEAAGSVVAVKSGKRSRYARHDGAVGVPEVSGFLDKILGGDMQFKNIKSLPEPDYTPFRNAA